MTPVTFWNSSNTADGLLRHNTTGDQESPAHRHIYGTAQGGVLQPAKDGSGTAASTVYPVYDGISNTLPEATRPADYNTNQATFVSWHSAYQAQYLKENGTEITRTDSSGVDQLSYTASLGGTTYGLTSESKVINLQAMTLSDYAKLPRVDQEAFHASFQALDVIQVLGLTTTKTGANSAITLLRNAINALPGHADVYGRFSTNDAQVFTRQLDILQTQVDDSHAILEDRILSEVKDIQARFNRVQQFAITPVPQNLGGIESVTLRTTDFRDTSAIITQANVNSLDSGQTISDGLTEFMRAERAIVIQKELRANIANVEVFRDPTLDVPNLIYRLQLLYNKESEGEADSGTEEIRQLHALLQDYAVMQQMMQQGIGRFNPKEADQQFALIADAELPNLTQAQSNAIAMFDNDYVPTNVHSGRYDSRNTHPIEILANATRPTTELVYDGRVIHQRRKTTVDAFITSISETITILNQQNQLKQNDIENSSKAKNRHFELGNNALRKMNDLLLSIGRM